MSRGNFKDLTGHQFTRLTVLSRAKNIGQYVCWNCLCVCGVEVIVRGDSLKAGDTKSCGCFRKEFLVATKTSHGMSDTPEYRAWSALKNRCSNPNDKGFINYGGRGISICDRWINSFANFYADMGNRPSANHSIDRIDNDDHYYPENCKWSTRTQQIRNRRIYKNNKSGVNGVSQPYPGRWLAMIRVRGKPRSLYHGPSFQLAVEARECGEVMFWTKQ